MKISQLVLVVVCLGSLVLLQNCGPGECEEHVPTHTKYTISSDDKSKIPFSGTDTLVYISTDGDTAKLYGQGKKAFIESVQKNGGGDPSCPRVDYNDLEGIQFSYKGDHFDLNSIIVNCIARASSYEETTADIHIGNVSYSTRLQYINHPANYKDTVTISSTTYNAIKIYSGTNFPYSYNYQFGFLKIITSQKIWLKRM